MFGLTVNDHVMIAHSLPDEFFGLAQGVHGATLEVSATFTRPSLDEHSVVLDIGEAMTLLDAALSPLRYANLDEHPDFTGKLSTTEAVAEYIGQRLAESLADRPEIGISIELRENPRAAITYTVPERA
ncbi:6-pyruvoyl tetrahydrobiopterin synthase [Brevibacterium linens]|uniref:6-carboxy-5,6,7,8-tetrahydropterin synthase n=2 Tax=Brevibacterium linens TaxID=1703 RepID=A0A142NL69_BRELN|nr:6-carboxytetrahydropterin synthase [Brevibacterium linens]AMT93533.1 6-pyruvoyl tetrahydrobiopterin synthase [Brevibacterium linens]